MARRTLRPRRKRPGSAADAMKAIGRGVGKALEVLGGSTFGTQLENARRRQTPKPKPKQPARPRRRSPQRPRRRSPQRPRRR